MCLRATPNGAVSDAERRTAMSAFDTTSERQSGVGERFVGVGFALLTWVADTWRLASNRRSVAKLLEWDERMLRDIGLTRGDVCSVMALPSGQDPSYRLSELSGERRAALRAEARERAALTRPTRVAGIRPRALPSKSYPFADL
jgi:uncharacterized protein YjiS (DUF1127 family)